GDLDSYNPLTLSREDEELIVEDAVLLAEAHVLRTGSADNFFFEEEARSLLSCLCMYLMTAERGTLGRLREVIAQPEDELRELLKSFRQKSNLAVIGRGAEQFLSKAPNERSGVLSTARQQTTFLDSAAIASSLASSTFRFSQMREEPISVYCVMPIDRLSTYG